MKIRLSRTWQVAQFESYRVALEEEVEGAHNSETIQKLFLDLAYEAHLAHDNYVRDFVKASELPRELGRVGLIETQSGEHRTDRPEGVKEPESEIAADVILTPPKEKKVPEGLSPFDLGGARARVGELIKEVGPKGKEISERYHDMHRTDLSRLSQPQAEALMRLLQKEIDDKQEKETS